MDRLFGEGLIRPSYLATAFSEGLILPVDMYHTVDEIVVKAALPGIKPEDLDIIITGDNLTITGETKVEREVKRENYIRQECRYGAFARSLTLPDGIEADKAEASIENGMLTLTIPKAEESKPKVVKVKAKETTESKDVETKS